MKVCVPVAVSLGMHIVVLGVQNLSLGTPGASTLARWGPFWELGDTLGAHGTRGGLESDGRKHSSKGLELVLGSVRFLNAEVLADWPDLLIGWWDYLA